ncbi:MAG TPA: hypothetical protein VHI93_05130, partial [Candidatus Thermoplasmatota archaeon]|nr:hypothetical protein [Candidatus Thermoplasmatota archaeon]
VAAPVPVPAAPDSAMADRYEAEVRPGARLLAATSFEGPFTGREGTDLDVGLYAPDGRPAACGSGPGAAPMPGLPSAPDPGQASASAAAQAAAGGAWSVRVGAQEAGCGGAAPAYANAGPVPYRLVLTVG